MRWLDNITDSVDMNLSKLWKIVKDSRFQVLMKEGMLWYGCGTHMSPCSNKKWMMTGL